MKKIVVISAVWCPSCLILKKHLKKLKEEYSTLEIETLDPSGILQFLVYVLPLTLPLIIDIYFFKERPCRLSFLWVISAFFVPSLCQWQNC